MYKYTRLLNTLAAPCQGLHPPVGGWIPTRCLKVLCLIIIFSLKQGLQTDITFTLLVRGKQEFYTTVASPI